MSVIAWDGKTLAADRRVTYGGTVLTTVKIHRAYDGCAIGVVGSVDHGKALVEWYNNGKDRESFPRPDSDLNAMLVVIGPEGSIRHYERSGTPIFIQEPFAAWGSGGDLAMGALAMGADAEAAVRVACKFNAYCGNGIDKIEVVQ